MAWLILKKNLDCILDSLEYKQGFFNAIMVDDCLRIDYSCHFSLTMFVDSISGRIRVTSDEKPLIPLLSLFEDKLNETESNIVNLLMFLLYEVHLFLK